MAYTIDPVNKRIVLDSADVTAKSIYAAWVDWVALSDNAKWPQAFSSVGGDNLGGGLLIPPYYFLLNEWRIRPMESNHNLTISGNLFVDGGGVPVVSTLGVFQVNVNYTVPVQAQGISTSGSSGPTIGEITTAITGAMIDPADIASAVRLALQTELARLDVAISSRQIAGVVPADIRYVNAIPITGVGTEASPWRPS